MSNLEWIYKARSPYWEEKSPGKRYGIIRLIKNRSEGNEGQYTQEAVEARLNITKGRLRNLETGATPEVYEALIPQLIADLGLTEELFYTGDKLRANQSPRPATSTTPTVVAPTVTLPVAVPTSTPTSFPPDGPVTYTLPKEPVQRKPRKPAETNPTTPTPGATPSTSSVPQTCVAKIVNHTVGSLVVVVRGDELHIMDDCAASLKVLHSIWVAPADDLGSGTKLIPRATSIIK